jgi:hypothetical protein
LSETDADNPGTSITDSIATAGRDGDIHIYDLRTTGREIPENGDSGNVSAEWKKRARNEGDPSDSIWPVLSIKGAHGIGPIKKERCVSFARCLRSRRATLMIAIETVEREECDLSGAAGSKLSSYGFGRIC